MNPMIYGFANAYLSEGQVVTLLEEDVPVTYVLAEDVKPGHILMVDADGHLARYRDDQGRLV